MAIRGNIFFCFNVNKFISNHFMNNKAYKKDKKSSKSAEKKHNYTKNQMNLLVYKNNQLLSHNQIKG